MTYLNETYRNELKLADAIRSAYEYQHPYLGRIMVLENGSHLTISEWQKLKRKHLMAFLINAKRRDEVE